MLKPIPLLATCLLISACSFAPVTIQMKVDQTCVLRKIQLEQNTLKFFARLFDKAGVPIVYTAMGDNGLEYSIQAPLSLIADIGEIRKQTKAYDAVCSGPVKVG
jgi:hypothetical protein